MSAALLAITLLAGCSGGSTSLGSAACSDVSRAAHLLSEASSARGSDATTLRSRANQLLETAGPLATQAAAGDGRWQALQATLGQVDRVPTSVLMPALRADCSQQGSA